MVWWKGPPGRGGFGDVLAKYHIVCAGFNETSFCVGSQAQLGDPVHRSNQQFILIFGSIFNINLGIFFCTV